MEMKEVVISLNDKLQLKTNYLFLSIKNNQSLWNNVVEGSLIRFKGKIRKSKSIFNEVDIKILSTGETYLALGIEGVEYMLVQ